ncbi:aspartate carbamoyltransferase [Methylomagnum ishizawai]|uniref:aspartate carbamoyltransferase n=1 Tax=Methylomagnum ishizawai TaxID=1760988 RepID=UPI001C390BA3|nr:aspartate carbamoyltransferase [Methylomagnum ishizawai]
MTHSKLLSLGFVLATSCLSALPAAAESDAARQAEVAGRGAQVMPFDLEKTRHIFTPTADGGVQQVVVLDPQDRTQIEAVRQHLATIAAGFRRGDFAGPIAIHGAGMPGLARLRQAQPGELDIAYREVADGGEIRYSSKVPAVVAAIHQYFEAQLADHGHHAMPGHPHPMHHP